MRTIIILLFALIATPASAKTYCYEQFPDCRLRFVFEDGVTRFEIDDKDSIILRDVTGGISVGYRGFVKEDGTSFGSYRFVDGNLLFNMEFYYPE